MGKFTGLLVTSRKTSPNGFNFTNLNDRNKKKRPKTTRERRISGIKKCLNNQVSEYRP